MTGTDHGNILQTILLSTKYTIPRDQARLVKRTRLFKLLNEGLHSRLTLISAVPGAGKTTLLSSWLASRSFTLAAWVTLDRGDNDPIRFWNYLVAALKSILPDLHIDISSSLQTATPNVLECLVITIINSLATLSQDITLILDDYHVIENPSIQESMTLFIDHLPLHLHIYMASRTIPPLPLPRLRARAQLLEIKATDLRFSIDEAAKFLHLTPSLVLSNTEIALLEKKTEGWAAGLHLAAISLRSAPSQSDFLTAFNGTHQHVSDYLLNEIFYQQSADIQSFLLSTSVLPHLTGSLCNAITERQDCQQLLFTLEQANLFLLPLDQTRHWYCYHQLFSEFLRWHLERTQAEIIPHLLSRASIWYAQQGMTQEAIEFALTAHDFDTAVHLLEQIADTLLKRRELTTFFRWLDLLPTDYLKNHPRLLTRQSWILLTIGQAEAAEQCLDLLGNTPDNPSISNEMATIRTTITALRGGSVQTLEPPLHITELHPDHSSWLYGVTNLNQGIIHTFSGNLSAAEDAFNAASQIGLKTDNHYGALIAACQLATLEQTQGKLHQSAATYTKALRLTQLDTSLLDASLAHIGLAGILLEWNHLPEATEQIQSGITQSKHSGNQGTLLFGYLALTQLQQAKGHLYMAQETLQEIEQLVRQQQPSSFLLHLLADTMIRSYLLQDNLTAAKKWHHFDQSTLHTPLDPFSLFVSLSSARLRLAEHDPHAALTILYPLQGYAEANQFSSPLLTILLLQAVALHTLKEQGQAVITLARAFALAEPEQYCRTFLEIATPITGLLRQLLRDQHQDHLKVFRFSSAYVQKIFSQLSIKNRQPSQHPPYVTPPQTSPRVITQLPISPLSARELEILRLIACGLSNQDITRRLIIEQNTLKTHIRHIYHKLVVRNRTSAIVRANELGILYEA